MVYSWPLSIKLLVLEVSLLSWLAEAEIVDRIQSSTVATMNIYN